jgi:hypothetical protein
MHKIIGTICTVTVMTKLSISKTVTVSVKEIKSHIRQKKNICVLVHEEERSRAIKSCLDRNPMAFHPKIGNEN